MVFALEEGHPEDSQATIGKTSLIPLQNPGNAQGPVKINFEKEY